MNLSIIVPIYNREKTLSRCLDSILSMKMQNYEVLLIDDGSTDGSKDICKKYELLDSRFNYYYKKNGGVSSARNLGLAKCSGIWVTFVDSDDFVSPNHFEDLADLLPKGYDFFMTGVGLNLEKRGGQNVEVKGNKQIVNEYFKKSFIANLEYSVINKCFLNQIIKENGIKFSKEISLGEDQIFVCQYLKHVHKCLYINKYTYCICVGSLDGLTNRKRSFKNLYVSTKAVFLSLFQLSIKTKSRAALLYSLNYLLQRTWNRFVKRALKILIRKK